MHANLVQTMAIDYHRRLVVPVPLPARHESTETACILRVGEFAALHSRFVGLSATFVGARWVVATEIQRSPCSVYCGRAIDDPSGLFMLMAKSSMALDLVSRGIGMASSGSIMEALEYVRLTKLDFGVNRFGAKGECNSVLKLTDLLRRGTSKGRFEITELRLDDCGIGNDSIAQISKVGASAHIFPCVHPSI